MPFCNVCLPNWFHLKCLYTKTALIGFSCKHSFMQRQSKDIWKCLFAKIIEECMQETPYNFPIKVSLLCIILPTKHKSGYDISLFFHPKVSFQCIIMPSTTKESLPYIYIFYIKSVLVLSNNLTINLRYRSSFQLFWLEGTKVHSKGSLIWRNYDTKQGLVWFDGTIIHSKDSIGRKELCTYLWLFLIWNVQPCGQSG